MQESCRLRPAKPPKGVEEARKGLQGKVNVASLSTRKRVASEEEVTDASESEEGSGKE